MFIFLKTSHQTSIDKINMMKSFVLMSSCSVFFKHQLVPEISVFELLFCRMDHLQVRAFETIDALSDQPLLTPVAPAWPA